MGVLSKIGEFIISIIEEAPEIISELAEKGERKQKEVYKNAEYKIRENERKVSRAEKSDKMNDPEYAKRVNETRSKLESAKDKLSM